MEKICKVEGCNKTCEAKGYCNRHYLQILKYGEIRRTRFDKNELVVHEEEGYVEIKLYDRHGNEKEEVALASIEDLEFIKQYKWYLMNTGYIATRVNGKNKTMHSLLMERIYGDYKEDGKEVDHINRNKRDNRRDNLRLCTRLENTHNREAKRIYELDNGKFEVKLMMNGTVVRVLTDDETEAMTVRDDLENRMFGEFRAKKKNKDKDK